MRFRKFATGAVLLANLGVLVATSSSDKGDYYTGYYTTESWTYTTWDSGWDTGWWDHETTDGSDYTIPTDGWTRDSGWSTTDTEQTGGSWVRTDVAGPLLLAFDANSRSVPFEIEMDVGQELLDAGVVTLLIDVDGQHALASDALLSVYELADPADPLPAYPLSSLLVPAAPGGALTPVALQLQVPIFEGGITTRYLALGLGGDGDLAGNVTFTLRATTPTEMLLPPLVIEVP